MKFSVVGQPTKELRIFFYFLLFFANPEETSELYIR